MVCDGAIDRAAAQGEDDTCTRIDVYEQALHRLCQTQRHYT